jgi:hypothetical protein
MLGSYQWVDGLENERLWSVLQQLRPAENEGDFRYIINHLFSYKYTSQTFPSPGLL